MYICNFIIKIKNKKIYNRIGSRTNELSIFELEFDLISLSSILTEFELFASDLICLQSYTRPTKFCFALTGY